MKSRNEILKKIIEREIMAKNPKPSRITLGKKIGTGKVIRYRKEK